MTQINPAWVALEHTMIGIIKYKSGMYFTRVASSSSSCFLKLRFCAFENLDPTLSGRVQNKSQTRKRENSGKFVKVSTRQATCGITKITRPYIEDVKKVYWPEMGILSLYY